jgi:hypothetical protein
LDVERRESTPYIAALLDAFLVEGPFLIFFGTGQVLAGAGMT